MPLTTKYVYIKSTTEYVPSSELGLPQPLARQRVCPSPQNRGGHTRLRVRGLGTPNSDDWRNSLALGLLCAIDLLIYFIARNLRTSLSLFRDSTARPASEAVFRPPTSTATTAATTSARPAATAKPPATTTTAEAKQTTAEAIQRSSTTTEAVAAARTRPQAATAEVAVSSTTTAAAAVPEATTSAASSTQAEDVRQGEEE
jgi:hypothetical protein